MLYENLGREHEVPFQLKCHIFGTDGEIVEVESSPIAFYSNRVGLHASVCWLDYENHQR